MAMGWPNKSPDLTVEQEIHCMSWFVAQGSTGQALNSGMTNCLKLRFWFAIMTLLRAVLASFHIFINNFIFRIRSLTVFPLRFNCLKNARSLFRVQPELLIFVILFARGSRLSSLARSQWRNRAVPSKSKNKRKRWALPSSALSEAFYEKPYLCFSTTICIRAPEASVNSVNQKTKNRPFFLYLDTLSAACPTTLQPLPPLKRINITTQRLHLAIINLETPLI